MFDLPATDFQKEREQKLLDYIDQHREEIVESTGSDNLIHLAKHYWTFLKRRVWGTSKQILEVPDCCPIARSIEGVDCIRFGWDKNEHYLECEILSDGTKEFFYKNRITKENMGEDYFPSANPLGAVLPNISEDILDKLMLFTE